MGSKFITCVNEFYVEVGMKLYIVSLVLDQHRELERLYYDICSSRVLIDRVGLIIVDGSMSSKLKSQVISWINLGPLDVVHLNDNNNGIYSALNLAVGAVPNDSSYLIVNPDDRLIVETLELFLLKTFQSGKFFACQFLSSSCDSFLARQRPSLVSILGTRSITSGHATCLICPKSWHDNNGLYSERFPIAGDIDFIYRVHKSSTEINRVNFPVAIFDDNGVSSRRRDKAHKEVLKIHRSYFGLLPTFLMWLRLRYRRL